MKRNAYTQDDHVYLIKYINNFMKCVTELKQKKIKTNNFVSSNSILLLIERSRRKSRMEKYVHALYIQKINVLHVR